MTVRTKLSTLCGASLFVTDRVIVDSPVRAPTGVMVSVLFASLIALVGTNASLTKICEVIDNGGGFIGSPLKHVPQHFLDRMAAADVIIGKGQGNYETIDDFDGNVFLILRAKCEVVAEHMGVKLNQVGLISTRQRAAAG